MRLAIRLVVLAAALACAAPVLAEDQAAPASKPIGRRPRVPAGFLSAGVGVQATRNDFPSTLAFTLYAEPAEFDSDYDVPAGLLVDVGGGLRVWRRLALGVTVARYENSSDARLRARLPHPFYFGRQRAGEGTAPGLHRTETAVHFQATWLVPLEPRVTLALSAGPTLFDVRQDIVTAIQLREIYPYDQVVLGAPVVVERRESTIGFNAGADVFYRLTRRFAIGGAARYTFGSLDVEGDADERIGLDTGGLHVTGGIRVLF